MVCKKRHCILSLTLPFSFRDKFIQIERSENAKLSFGVAAIRIGMDMDTQLKKWELWIDRLWSAAAIDWHEATRLALDIASAADDDTLRRAASQGLPSLRNAALWAADNVARSAARRRLGVIGEALHAVSTPRFGKRDATPKTLTVEQHYRQLLGLPLDRHLNAPEIRQAFKRAAKAVHPDAGGDAQAFLELSAARDALMKQGIRYR
jgi:hypothetical protein